MAKHNPMPIMAWERRRKYVVPTSPPADTQVSPSTSEVSPHQARDERGRFVTKRRKRKGGVFTKRMNMTAIILAVVVLLAVLENAA